MTTVDFGFEKVSPADKHRLVDQVFSSVSPRYDLMNDLMSLGIHRLWKRFAVYLSGVRNGQSVLDVAGGTGDLAALFQRQVGNDGLVLVTDINKNMLVAGRNRLIDRGMVQGLQFVQADAESLPFRNNFFNCVSIGFGLRNVTDKDKALRSMYEKAGYGGRIIILEFSKVVLPVLKNIYDNYSFNFIPWLGKIIAHDEASYRYLVESIRMHPDQETLKTMMEQAGFARVEYFNLSGGIVAVHRGWKI